ncbi:MAG: Bacterial regulatory protein luxR family [Solirubrobacteraceae bacterium]|jgi:DNA-binding CsgD family transcriptional regulator|nr:Bacterial regulatory protein luxR family [Solirubrobacteraceae bacterium]
MPPVEAMRARQDQRRLSLGVLTLVLSLSLWVAAGLLLVGAIDGGPHPTRRLAVGVALVAATAAALWRRRALCEWLCARPWLVVPIAVVQVAAAALDGLLPMGPYLGFSLTSIALAVVVARPRTVWLTVLAAEATLWVALLAEQLQARETISDHLSAVLGGVLGLPFSAIAGLAIVSLFARFLTRVDPLLNELRASGSALTPALTRAIVQGPRSLAELPPPAPWLTLTPAERRVVEALATGISPKEFAFRRRVSLETVRSHIKHAKRKTNARTLSQLAALTARADWPGPSDPDD